MVILLQVKGSAFRTAIKKINMGQGDADCFSCELRVLRCEWRRVEIFRRQASISFKIFLYDFLSSLLGM